MIIATSGTDGYLALNLLLTFYQAIFGCALCFIIGAVYSTSLDAALVLLNLAMLLQTECIYSHCDDSDHAQHLLNLNSVGVKFNTQVTTSESVIPQLNAWNRVRLRLELPREIFKTTRSDPGSMDIIKSKNFYILIVGSFNQNKVSLRSNVSGSCGHKCRRLPPG